MKTLSLSVSIPRTGTGNWRRIASSPSATSDCSRARKGNRFRPARTHVGRDEAPEERSFHGTAAVGDEVHFEGSRQGVSPIREGAHRELLRLG